jgi:type IV pilus assembly protein PilQ
MDAILGENFKYEPEGKLIKVYTKDEYKKLKEDPARMIYKVFTLYYVTAAEAKKLITPVLSGNQSARIETTTAAVTDFPTGESISSVTGGGDTAAMHDTIIVYDYPENVELVAQVLSMVDIRPKQVLVEATVLSASLTEEIATGIDWNSLYGVSVGTIANIGTGAGEGLAQAGFATAVKTTTSTGGFSAGITNDHVAVLIRALEEVTDITILANPKILAVNKQLGQVYIGKKLGYRSQTTQTQTSTTEQVQFLDTGTKLSFRPYIGDDGYIRMDIHPKDSAGSLRGDIPDETSAELVTNIIVKDGQTIVIGGLFRDVVTTTRYQIPLLGDLPIVGVLFRGKADKNERQEVIVMLTPHVIEEPEETNGDGRGEDVSRKRAGANDELQWIGRGKLAEDHYAKATEYYMDGNNAAAMEELEAALRLRPSYLEAIRLKERITAEEDGQEALDKLERTMADTIDSQEAPNWRRR